MSALASSLAECSELFQALLAASSKLDSSNKSHTGCKFTIAASSDEKRLTTKRQSAPSPLKLIKKAQQIDKLAQDFEQSWLLCFSSISLMLVMS